MSELRNLYLLRHGLADTVPVGAVSDDDRVLSPEGVARTSAASAALERLTIAPAAIWTSPLPRARQTAAIVAAALGRPAPLECEALAPDAEPGDLFPLLAASGLESVLLVGHNPFLETLAALLIGARRADAVALGKGSLAQFKLHAVPGPRSARLIALWREKDLIRLADGNPQKG